MVAILFHKPAKYITGSRKGAGVIFDQRFPPQGQSEGSITQIIG